MAEQRLIDANALPYENQVLSCDDEWCLKVSDIENSPTIDAVPVVRCAECKWGKAYKAWDGKAGFKCELFCYETGFNDFCSCGERKGGDE